MQSLVSSLRALGVEELDSLNTNPVKIYRTYITKLLARLTGAAPSIITKAIQSTQTFDKGDLLLPVPALRLKGCKSDELAQKIRNEFPDQSFVERPVIDGSFVQLTFKPAQLSSIVLPLILGCGPNYGRNFALGQRDPDDPSQGRKRVIVDFGSPNIAKPFHAGHLRSTIIGGFIANLYEQANWDVVRLNYLGDWGKQYGVLGVGFTDFGSHEKLEREPISHLFDVYVKVSAISRKEQEHIKKKQAQKTELESKGEPSGTSDVEIRKLQDESVDERARQYFKRMCDGDEEALSLWKTFRELSITRYKDTFARLNIFYDIYHGESQIKDSSIETAAKILDEKGLSEDSYGAKIVDLTKHSKKLGKAIIRKKDGTSIYLTRDIAGVFERQESYHYDKMIYVIADQQDLHMAQLIKIIELMGRDDLAKRLQHINFGLVSGMSTRRETVKFLDDILRDAAEKMHEVMRSNELKYAQVENPEKTADTLGISAVLVQDMGGKRINGYTFDMNRMTSFEGDTGPYLQYSHARLCSIIRKADCSTDKLKQADFSMLTEKHAIDLVRRLAQWPDLTHALNSSYDHLNVLKSDPNVKLARLALYYCARQVISNCMRLLNLSPVERM